MTKTKSPSQLTESQQERLRALLALASGSAPQGTPCLSSEEMAAMVDGRLTETEREKAILHLDECSRCYREWLAVASLETARSESPKERGSRYRRFIGSRRLTGAGIAAALAACLVLVFVWSARPPVEVGDLLDRSYRTGLSHGMFAKESVPAQDIRFPWEKPPRHYGFGSAAGSPPEARAFGAGLWTERSILAGGDVPGSAPGFLAPSGNGGTAISLDSWLKTPSRRYFELGRWVMLLSTACQSATNAPDAFWDEQAKILAEISKAFPPGASPEEIARFVALKLQHLNEIFAARAKGPDRFSPCRSMIPALEAMVERLAPSSPPQ